MQKQATTSAGTRGRYLYAVVAGSTSRAFDGLGINGGRVYTIPDGEVAAIVSDVPNQRIRPERRHFAAHQAVLKTLMRDCDLLPISFGIISKGPKAVRSILSRNRDAITDQLKRVSGKVEMGLKVHWDVPNIFEYMIDIHSDLSKARDRLLSPHRRPTQEEKIEIGQMFEDLLNADRDRHTKKVERVLAPRCFEVKRNKCRSELEVMNLACLVGRDSLADFEAGVLQAAAFFDDNFAFDYNGPWAPHNFVDLEVDI